MGLGGCNRAVAVLGASRVQAATDVTALLIAADRYRSGQANLQVETEVKVLNRDDSTDKERRYTVFAQAQRKSLVLMRSPAEQGQKLLMLGDDFWLLLPGSQRALRITASQKLLGDASTGDIATLSWAEDYGGTLTGEEICAAQALKPSRPAGSERAGWRQSLAPGDPVSQRPGPAGRQSDGCRPDQRADRMVVRRHHLGGSRLGHVASAQSRPRVIRQPARLAAELGRGVFITAYDEYAVQAFEAQAVDYLLRPLQPERLAICCERLRQRLAQRTNPGSPLALNQAVEHLRALLGPTGATAQPASPRLDVLQAGVGATLHLVPLDDVIYFEAADKYLRVITVEREHLIRLSLRELLPQLDAQRFWQVHRGLVVQARCNTSAVREESGRVLLTLRGRAEKLSVSRLCAHLFKAM